MRAARPSFLSTRSTSRSMRRPSFPLLSALAISAAGIHVRPVVSFSVVGRQRPLLTAFHTGAAAFRPASRHLGSVPTNWLLSSPELPAGPPPVAVGVAEPYDARRRRRRTVLAAAAMAATGIYSDASPEIGIASPPAASLASSYALYISEEGKGGAVGEFLWSLYPIDDEGLAGCVGAAAVRALRTPPPPPAEDGEEDAAHVLRCRVERSADGRGISIAATSEGGDGEEGDEDDLISALGRILVQWAAARSTPAPGDSSPLSDVHVSLPGGEKMALSAEDVLGDSPTALFGLTERVEMSEMVDAAGERLGVVPRPLVHKFNLLHRGIGIVVSRDEHIRQKRPGGTTSATPITPDVYCHRRTDSKRIFPSMYDMFVGGVSTAGERPALTAAREVAEEYGLGRAVQYLEGKEGHGNGEDVGKDVLSDPLFKCTVCTSYNRCVVTVFTYKYRTDLETASWQEEEVAWGDFVPYPVVERAARMDIDRLKEEGKWPGTGYGEVPPMTGDEEEVPSAHGVRDWEEWRFVPDGLLVWEAWVAWRDGCEMVAQ